MPKLNIHLIWGMCWAGLCLPVRAQAPNAETIIVTGTVLSGTDGNPNSNPPGAGRIFGGDNDLSGQPFTLTIQISETEGTPNSPGKCADGTIYTSSITGSNTSSAPTARLEIGTGGGSFTYGALSLYTLGWSMGRSSKTSCSGYNTVSLGWSESEYAPPSSGDYTGNSGFGGVVLYTQNDLSPGEWFTPVFLQSVTSAPLHFTITVNQSSNVFNNLKAANGYLIPQFVSVSGPASSCDICAQIARQSKSSNGEALSLELCHELLGALEELGRYRSAFLTDANFVNLFPTAYYDVTALEMQRIAAGTYKYPIEKMQQMLAFFDAYKSNRDAWNLGATPEPHWAAYYAAAHNANEVLSILVAMSRLPDLSPFSTVALDLQAALRRF